MCQALFEGSENTVNIQTEISLLEKGSYYAVGRNVNWGSNYRQQQVFLKKLKSELLDNAANPLLGIHPEKTPI